MTTTLEIEQQLLPYYDELYAKADLKFKGLMLDPNNPYDNKLQLIRDTLNTFQFDPEVQNKIITLERRQLSRIFYWLDQRFKREQKAQREAIPDRYKSEDFKRFEKWERSYDPARHNIFNARKLSEQEVDERGIKLPQ